MSKLKNNVLVYDYGLVEFIRFVFDSVNINIELKLCIECVPLVKANSWVSDAKNEGCSFFIELYKLCKHTLKLGCLSYFNDTICNLHNPDNTLKELYYYLSTCYGCLSVVDTTCAMQNNILIRVLFNVTICTMADAYFCVALEKL